MNILFWIQVVVALATVGMIGLSYYRRRWFSVAGFFTQIVGIGCNLTALATNNFHMPVAEPYFSRYGGADEVHSLLTSYSQLPALCDIYPGRSSIGDALLYLGMILIFIQLFKPDKEVVTP